MEADLPCRGLSEHQRLACSILACASCPVLEIRLVYLHWINAPLVGWVERIQRSLRTHISDIVNYDVSELLCRYLGNPLSVVVKCGITNPCSAILGEWE